MRLHRNLVYTTIDSLNAIFNEGEYADKVVARALKTNVGEALIENLLPKPSGSTMERLYAEMQK
jgi:hypothetical protein